MRSTQHQGNKYAKNPEIGGWIKDGFTEWRYKSGEAIPPDDLPQVPNADKIKISFVRKVVNDFVYFDVKHKSNSGTDTIGRVTEYTTEDRLASMIYRYYNPDHAKPCTFSGTVSAISGRKGSKMFYLQIPQFYIEACDLKVDDEVRVNLTCMGLSYTFFYHLSQTGYFPHVGEAPQRLLILPLTQVKRLVAVDDPDSIDEFGNASPIFRYVTKKTYDEHTRQIARGEPLEYQVSYRPRKTKSNPDRHPVVTAILPCRRFIDEFNEVTAEIIPEAFTVNNWQNAHNGRFDFAIGTINRGGRYLNPD